MATYDEWVAALEHAYQPTTGAQLSREGVHVALSVAMIEGGLRTSGRLSWASRKVFDNLTAWGWLDPSTTWEQWSLAVQGSNNLGAVQYMRPSSFGASPWPAISSDGRGFLYYDTSPQADGTSTPYPMYFRRYTVDDAASGFLRTLYAIHGRASVREAAERGDLYEVSRLLRATRYYEGFGATQDERIARHHRALSSAAITVARALGWPMPDGSELPPQTLRQGDSGQEVERLQAMLNVEPDGVFGAFTASAVRRFQASQGLKVDGIVGPQTWGVLLETQKLTDPPAPPDTDPEPIVPGDEEPTTDMALEVAVANLERAQAILASTIAGLRGES